MKLRVLAGLVGAFVGGLIAGYASGGHWLVCLIGGFAGGVAGAILYYKIMRPDGTVNINYYKTFYRKAW
ncbi:hypothetical protein [Clostridium sulfidigenes]|uniref:hypothetical protein n=1 Tax=Clostridium sulfidigenes TaxID=318464 RepID=UPI003F88C598